MIGFKKAPSLLSLETVFDTSTQVCIDGKWMPARSLGFFSIGHRIHCAWLVFTGKADALKWPGDQ